MSGTTYNQYHYSQQETWLSILNWLDGYQYSDASRAVYELFFEHYPTASTYWVRYIQRELSSGNLGRAEVLFSRCLKTNPCPVLYNEYIRHVKQVWRSEELDYNVVKEAFKFALTQVGMDVNSHEIWHSYFEFLDGINNTGERISSTRRAYHVVLKYPIEDLNSLCTFEKQLDQAFEGVISNKRDTYHHSNKVLASIKNLLNNIDTKQLALPPGYVKNYKKQVKLWKKYIAYEKTNPLRLTKNDLYNRLTFVYNKCLLSMYRYPEFWYEATQNQVEFGQFDEALKVYERGLRAVPDSLLFHFAYADFLSERNSIEGNFSAKRIYSNLLKRHPDNPLVYIVYIRFARRVLGSSEADRIFFEARKSGKTTYHIYVAAAKMELVANKDTNIALKIFELGYKEFKHDPSFVLEYIKFLESTNDRPALGALFEDVLLYFKEEKRNKEIWRRYQQYINGMSIDKQIKTSMQEYTDAFDMKTSIDRYKFLGLYPCSVKEMISFCGNDAFIEYGNNDRDIDLRVPDEIQSRPDLDSLEPLQMDENEVCKTCKSNIHFTENCPQKSDHSDQSEIILPPVEIKKETE